MIEKKIVSITFLMIIYDILHIQYLIMCYFKIDLRFILEHVFIDSEQCIYNNNENEMIYKSIIRSIRFHIRTLKSVKIDGRNILINMF